MPHDFYRRKIPAGLGSLRIGLDILPIPSAAPPCCNAVGVGGASFALARIASEAVQRYDRRMRRIAVALVMSCTGAQAEHQDWVVSHQPDRFQDHVMMEAWADADHGPARLQLYCDAQNGFRVMFLPGRPLLEEGPARITLVIDASKQIVLDGQAFGDDQTDVVTVLDSARIQKQISTARRVKAHFQGLAGHSGDDAFTLGALSGHNALLMKVCLTG
jgi:hypothetical protein